MRSVFKQRDAVQYSYYHDYDIANATRYKESTLKFFCRIVMVVVRRFAVQIRHTGSDKHSHFLWDYFGWSRLYYTVIPHPQRDALIKFPSSILVNNLSRANSSEVNMSMSGASRNPSCDSEAIGYCVKEASALLGERRVQLVDDAPIKQQARLQHPLACHCSGGP